MITVANAPVSYGVFDLARPELVPPPGGGELLDADMVVFGGPYWRVLEPWYAPAARRAVRRPSARGPHPVTVVSTAMGENVGAIGAASVVHDSLYVPRAPSSAGR